MDGISELPAHSELSPPRDEINLLCFIPAVNLCLPKNGVGFIINR